MIATLTTQQTRELNEAVSAYWRNRPKTHAEFVERVLQPRAVES